MCYSPTTSHAVTSGVGLQLGSEITSSRSIVFGEGCSHAGDGPCEVGLSCFDSWTFDDGVVTCL